MVESADPWEEHAEDWAELVRSGGDAPFAWNGSVFLDLVPPPGALTVDVGCGEGRLARELHIRGHRVVAVDSSPTLVDLAREADPKGDYRVADAGALPLGPAEADLVVAFMVLHDLKDAEAAVRDAGRVLVGKGRFCFAIVHPVASAGRFDDEERFVIAGSYLDPFAQRFPLGAGEVPSFHRSLESYFGALERVGFLVEAVRELPSRRRAPGHVPMFLHVRAVKQ